MYQFHNYGLYVNADELALLVDSFDKDGDREIDYDEFSKLMKTRMEENIRARELIKIFKLYTFTMNGLISIPQIHVVLTYIGLPLRIDDIMNLI